MFKVLLWDIDNTLLDFSLAESNSLKAAFKRLSLGECTDEMVSLYSGINAEYWEKLEKGEMTKAEILEGRFTDFLQTQGIAPTVAPAFNRIFEKGLMETVVPIENSCEIVKSLKGTYKQYAVTNGAYEVQRVKLQRSGLADLFDGAFISDRVGFEKPSKRFFDFVFRNIEPCSKDEILIIGDSLTSDMQGGNNAGISCCRYNPEGLPNPPDLKIDYNIRSLNEIYNILGGI